MTSKRVRKQLHDRQLVPQFLPNAPIDLLLWLPNTLVRLFLPNLRLQLHLKLKNPNVQDMIT